MIEIEAVQPNAREFREIRKGWGLIHWVCMLPTHAFVMGFMAFGLVAVGLSDGHLPPGIFGMFLIGTWAVWFLGRQWLTYVARSEQARSPAGTLPWRWKIDESALTFDNGLQSNRVDWRAVKAAREESDRFLFLVTPGYNPVLPKRQMSETQISALRTLIADATASGKLGGGASEAPA